MKSLFDPVFISADTQPLAVALAVFVVIAVLAVAFIVLLFTVPKFRRFFFDSADASSENRTKKRQTKATEKREKRTNKNGKQSEKRAYKSPSKKSTAAREAAASALPYDDNVPTVPLGGFSSSTDTDENIMRRTSDAYITMSLGATKHGDSAKPKKAEDTFDKIPTVVIPITADEVHVKETPRTVTHDHLTHTYAARTEPRTGERTAAAHTAEQSQSAAPRADRNTKPSNTAQTAAAQKQSGATAAKSSAPSAKSSATSASKSATASASAKTAKATATAKTSSTASVKNSKQTAAAATAQKSAVGTGGKSSTDKK